VSQCDCVCEFASRLLNREKPASPARHQVFSRCRHLASARSARSPQTSNGKPRCQHLCVWRSRPLPNAHSRPKRQQHCALASSHQLIQPIQVPKSTALSLCGPVTSQSSFERDLTQPWYFQGRSRPETPVSAEAITPAVCSSHRQATWACRGLASRRPCPTGRLRQA